MGSEYERAHRSLLFFHSDANIAANSSRFYWQNSFANDISARVLIAFAGVLSNLFCESLVAPGAGETFTYTVMINGLASALTCQTAGAVLTLSNDIVNEVAVAPGDTISIRCTTSLNAAATRHKNGAGFR